MLTFATPFGNEGKFIERIGNNKVQASTDFNTIKIKKEQSVDSFYRIIGD